jgi:hypothetical protein
LPNVSRPAIAIPSAVHAASTEPSTFFTLLTVLFWTDSFMTPQVPSEAPVSLPGRNTIAAASPVGWWTKRMRQPSLPRTSTPAKP